MFPFPKIMPQVKIEEYPGENLEISCLDAQTFFVLFEPGASLEFAFYDHPKPDSPVQDGMVLTGVHRLDVTGKLWVRDKELLEINANYADVGSDFTELPSTVYYHLTEDGFHVTNWIERSSDRPWKFRDEEETTPFPFHLYPGLKLNGVEKSVAGSEIVIDQHWVYEVAGAAQVSIGCKNYRCLKVVRTCWKGDEPATLAMYYVADTGRTVFFRRYDGKSFWNYPNLEGKPTIQHQGAEWRYFYDCIPDHAFIV
jgi:hypothetical protein